MSRCIHRSREKMMASRHTTHFTCSLPGWLVIASPTKCKLPNRWRIGGRLCGAIDYDSDRCSCRDQFRDRALSAITEAKERADKLHVECRQREANEQRLLSEWKASAAEHNARHAAQQNTIDGLRKQLAEAKAEGLAEGRRVTQETRDEIVSMIYCYRQGEATTAINVTDAIIALLNLTVVRREQ